MRVEQYSDRYFLDVVKLVENFHKETLGKYDSDLDPAALIETIRRESYDSRNVFLLILGNRCEGILAGHEFKSMINHTKIFQEYIWYTNKPFGKYGIRLIKEVQKILKSRGVNAIILSILEAPISVKLKRIYNRLGYKHLETHFVRAL